MKLFPFLNRTFFSTVTFFLTVTVHGSQTDSISAPAGTTSKGGLAITGFVDSYYFKNLNNPQSGSNLGRSGFERVFDQKEGQFQIGMAQVKLDYIHKKSEGVIGLPTWPFGNPENDSATGEVAAKFFMTGFSEIYYTYDLGNPEDHNRPGFIYSHNRHNEINLNLGYVKTAFQSERERANFALMAGTYSNANLSAEPGVLKNILEANAGFKISKNNNIWIDAGVFSSHIGFESAHSPSCATLTRSMAAENSPYFESGAKLTFISPNEYWLLSGLVLNGWQRIQRLDGNQKPCFGTQITFTPSEKISVNSSSFIGNDKPDSIKQMRYFHDFYGIFQIHSNVSAILGFDYGAEQKGPDSSSYNTWYSPMVIFKIQTNKKFAVGLRGEYFSDENGVVISTGTPNGFQTMGYSLNIDYSFTENSLLRIEGRGLISKDKIFLSDKWLSDQNYFITTSLAVTF